jgi:hypothetical protein
MQAALRLCYALYYYDMRHCVRFPRTLLLCDAFHPFELLQFITSHANDIVEAFLEASFTNTAGSSVFTCERNRISILPEWLSPRRLVSLCEGHLCGLIQYRPSHVCACVIVCDSKRRHQIIVG